MMEPLQRVLKSRKPLTLAGVPAGFLPWLAADLARAAFGATQGSRAVAIVGDEAAMRALAETVPLFAPEVELLTLPGWDCLPYDRASPALRVMAERLATLSALQAKPDKVCDSARDVGIRKTLKRGHPHGNRLLSAGRGGACSL